jgi:peptidoglycan/LPS O-acetylase OafA/YrhL
MNIIEYSKKYDISLFWLGQSMVCLFFILSGFVLSYKFIGEQSRIKVVEALIKRPFRLLGVVLFTSIGAINIDKIIENFSLYCSFKYPAKSFMVLFEFGQSVNEPLWTIPIELIGSIITFVILFLVSSLSKRTRVIILIALFFYYIKNYYCAFLFGIIVADLHKNYICKDMQKLKNIAGIILIFSGAYMILFMHDYYPDIIKLDFKMFGAMIIFIGVLISSWTKNILNIKLLIFIGQISYSLYACHWLVQKYFFAKVYSSTGCGIYMDILFFALSFTVTILIAWLIDIFIDKPCIKISNYIGKKIVKELI